MAINIWHNYSCQWDWQQKGASMRLAAKTKIHKLVLLGGGNIKLANKSEGEGGERKTAGEKRVRERERAWKRIKERSGEANWALWSRCCTCMLGKSELSRVKLVHFSRLQNHLRGYLSSPHHHDPLSIVQTWICLGFRSTCSTLDTSIERAYGILLCGHWERRLL